MNIRTYTRTPTYIVLITNLQRNTNETIIPHILKHPAMPDPFGNPVFFAFSALEAVLGHLKNTRLAIFEFVGVPILAQFFQKSQKMERR